MANNRFGEKVILLNKEKVCPSSNAKSDEFFRKTVAFNVLSLWSYKEAVSRATDTIPHGNCHFPIAKLPDVSLLVKYMIENSIFKKKLGCTGINNNSVMSAFPNMWYIEASRLSNSKVLNRYVKSTRGNWDNYNQNNKSLSNTVGNNKLESKAEDPDNFYDINN